MNSGNSLLIDTGGGEQIVRRPRRTDAIGAVLRESFGAVRPLPLDMRRLLARLSGKSR